jgi:hypothetical protein
MWFTAFQIASDKPGIYLESVSLHRLGCHSASCPVLTQTVLRMGHTARMNADSRKGENLVLSSILGFLWLLHQSAKNLVT